MIYKYCLTSDGYAFENIKKSQLLFKTLDKYNDLFEGDHLLLPSDVYNNDRTLFSGWHLKSFKESFVICCFSSSFNNQALWANYAEDSKGVCLEFDETLFPSYFRDLEAVIYSDEPRNLIQDGKVCILKISKTKNTKWSYEEEQRILISRYLLDNPNLTSDNEKDKVRYLIDNPPNKLGDGVYLCHYPKEALRSVCLGAKADLKANKDLLQWCREKGVDRFQMVPDRMISQLVRQSLV